MHRVALVMHETTMLYEAAIAAEVFGVKPSDLPATSAWYDLVVCTPDGSPHPWFPDVEAAPFNALTRVDSVIIPSTSEPDAAPEEGLLQALRDAYPRGVRIASLCTGAFVLAASGLLDGRSATTHWIHADDLARQHPLINVHADVLYIDEGQVLTSAGKTAALDLCLHLVSRDFGAAAANGLARRLVVPAHRRGGQAQFTALPIAVRNPEGIGTTLEWARGRLDRPLTVQDLAREAGFSSRQLARRMQAELQLSPLAWIQRQRIAQAQELLERTTATIEQIATRCGLGSAATLRRHFHKHVGVTPTAYREAFRSLPVTQLVRGQHHASHLGST